MPSRGGHGGPPLQGSSLFRAPPALPSINSVSSTEHFALRTPHSPLRIPHSALRIPHSALPTSHFPSFQQLPPIPRHHHLAVHPQRSQTVRQEPVVEFLKRIILAAI